MEGAEETILRNRLIPSPVSMTFTGDGFYRINNQCRVHVHGGDAALVKELFLRYWSAVPEICSFPAEKTEAESYSINCTENVLEISAADAAGLRYGLNTLRQLAEPERGTKTCSEYILPEFRLEDSPAMKFRAVHLCVFPETTAVEIEKKLRLAAFWKFNYVVIEFWGTYRFESFPEYCWEEKVISGAEVRNWMKIASEAGLTLIPQFNMLGHAAASRNRSDKHVLLDRHPEFASLFEPEGWTWCLSNPETQKILHAILDELLDLFGNPPYFHIGCDEADDLGHCAVCRKIQPRLLLKEHLEKIAEHLRARDCRPLIWHDMLLERDDDRWYHFTANGHSSLESAKLCQELPRDIIIADWVYGWPKEDKDWPLPDLDYFKDSGFDVIVSPWSNTRGIHGYAKAVFEKGLMGMMVTTWNLVSGNSFFQIFHHAAKSVWEGSDFTPENQCDRLNFTRDLRWMIQDAGLVEYRDLGSVTEQLRSETEP